MHFFELSLEIAAWLISVPLILLLGIFTLEVVAGLARQDEASPAIGATSVVILIPAHNEGMGLASSLAALKLVIPSDARVLIIADNCSDATADIGRNAGFEVIERHNLAARGKGYALAFARDHLLSSPPECVIVLDADCIPDPGTIEILRAETARHGVPVQATNLLNADLSASPMVQISNFAFLVKNLIRQRGATRIGHVAILGGTGMALPWDLFAQAPLASSDLVEDLSLGIYALRAGKPPRFVEAARVESAAADSANALTQRTRWEHGFLQTAAKRAIPLIAEGVLRRDASSLWMGCHLSVPPLAMLCGLSAIGAALLGISGIVTRNYLPAMLVVAALSSALIMVFIVWVRDGRRYLSAQSLLTMPLYVLWKLPIYLKLFGKREQEWKRTKRPGE